VTPSPCVTPSPLTPSPRRRDQGGEVVYELQRGEGQRGAPVALWFWQAVDDPILVDLLDALKGEGRAGAVA